MLSMSEFSGMANRPFLLRAGGRRRENLPEIFLDGGQPGLDQKHFPVGIQDGLGHPLWKLNPFSGIAGDRVG